MGENVKKQKKSGSINAFVIVFFVIVGCYIMSLFISPGARPGTSGVGSSG